MWSGKSTALRRAAQVSTTRVLLPKTFKPGRLTLLRTEPLLYAGPALFPLVSYREMDLMTKPMSLQMNGLYLRKLQNVIYMMQELTQFNPLWRLLRSRTGGVIYDATLVTLLST